jgi:hypothetical protein
MVLRSLAKPRPDRIVVDVGDVVMPVVAITNAVIRVAALPDRKLGAKSSRESAFDQLDGPFQGNACGCQQQMDVIGHHDEGVQLEVPSSPIVLQNIEEEGSVRIDLEESTTVVGAACHEKRAVIRRTDWDCHRGAKHTSAAEADLYCKQPPARLKPCPYDSRLPESFLRGLAPARLKPCPSKHRTLRFRLSG